MLSFLSFRHRDTHGTLPLGGVRACDAGFKLFTLRVYLNRAGERGGGNTERKEEKKKARANASRAFEYVLKRRQKREGQGGAMAGASALLLASLQLIDKRVRERGTRERKSNRRRSTTKRARKYLLARRFDFFRSVSVRLAGRKAARNTDTHKRRCRFLLSCRPAPRPPGPPPSVKWLFFVVVVDVVAAAAAAATAASCHGRATTKTLQSPTQN